GFCHEVLAELGTIGDLEPGTVFVEDVSDLLEEVLDDLYVRRFHRRGNARFDRAQALRIARAAAFNPTDTLEPRDAPPDSAAAMRYRLATVVRTELERRKRRLAIMTYDDLLTRLADTLKGPSGAAAAARLRSRYEVVLVDEFQDTDPVQWQILHRSFANAGVTLVLIADPKQAIYAFRGADVYAYLVAASTAATRATLPVNHRSDQALLDAYDAVFAGARLGHEQIVYRRATAAPANRAPRLRGAPSAAALRVRVVLRDEPTIEQTTYGFAKAPSVRQHIARDVAADIVALLSAGAQLEQRAPDGAPADREALEARHVAVLVRTHRQAELVLEALRAAQVPAVINGAGSVFATPAVRDWLTLLEAIERPTASSRAAAAALTPFIGWTAQQVATASERDWDEVHRRLHHYSRVLREGGVATLTETIMATEQLPARVLVAHDGERRLTDLRHLGQLLHRAASAERLGVTALRGWLAQRIASARREEGEEERARRLESDAAAVQVLTTHRSKGLEFPVVYCPFLWEPGYVPRDPEPVFFHDPAAGNRRTIDVGLDSRGFEAHVRQHRLEQRGEDLRLAYVALTRAKHQAVIWWAGSFGSRDSPLGRLLFAKDAAGNVAPQGSFTAKDADAVKRLRELAAQAPGSISVERSTLGLPTAYRPPLAPAAQLSAAALGRSLDLRWRRTSYSDITAAAHDAVVASEAEEQAIGDEPEVPAPIAELAAGEGGGADAGAGGAGGGEGDGAGSTLPGALSRPSLLADAPVGVAFGTFVHRVLQASEFAAADLHAELASRVGAPAARRWLAGADPAAVVAGLQAALQTPLGPLVDGLRLADVRCADRLDELEFELPLAGGDQPSGRLTLSAIAAALRALLPADDPLAGYAARLQDPALRATVRGFLTGSIDVVLRLPGPRFAIVDYKTNWLAPAGAQLTLGDYRPAALAAEMSRAHYCLQALLYTVALHRYLRWRLTGYDPERHLAAVLYLFVRGMAGADTPVVDGARCGVFGWRPDGALVHALSDVLDRGVPA
ncbi:MAG: UvrD-helicase domain-containing protein, partial [Solirubrobacteraceae bacterium]